MLLADNRASSPLPCRNVAPFVLLGVIRSICFLRGIAREENPRSLERASSMQRFLCGLMVLGLLMGVTGQATAQPTYNFTTLDVPGSTDTWASGINDSGQIVGGYFGADGTHGFLLDQGSYTTLDVPGARYTWATGINASGQIVGGYSDAAGGQQGFLATPVP